jgi:hypothetical protein
MKLYFSLLQNNISVYEGLLYFPFSKDSLIKWIKAHSTGGGAAGKFY